MQANIVSIASGEKITYNIKGHSFQSSYKKDSFYNFIDVDQYGILNDTQSDKLHHGGLDKSIHIGSSLHFDKLHDIDKLAFGCNIFIDTYSEKDICIGDIYSIGDIQFEVSQPRQPCWKISALFGKKVSRYIVQNYATGWYVRVLAQGILDINDDMILEKRVSDISIKELSEFLINPPQDAKLINKILNTKALAQSYKNDLTKQIDKQKDN
jgi:MOSC domain-containing protein YiiM